MRTPRGRICTPLAWEYMKRKMPGDARTDAEQLRLNLENGGE